jgi:hypothetical protein
MCSKIRKKKMIRQAVILRFGSGSEPEQKTAPGTFTNEDAQFNPAIAAPLLH